MSANCALYVRGETGVALYGAAGGWWDQAAGRYQRGQVPAAGAILVFKRTGHMRSGHVALVTKVISAREILVDHANWYHGTVTRGMPVIDTSPNHDWSSVAVMELHSGKFGRDNPTFGFVYPATGPRAAIGPEGLVHFAVATEYLDSSGSVSGERRNYLRRVRTQWAAHTRDRQTSSAAD